MPILTSTGSVSRKAYYKKAKKKSMSKPRQTHLKIVENNPVRDYTVYTLLLENEKYYIGLALTSGVDKRYKQHGTCKGAKWTRVYKPVEMISTKALGFMTLSKACIFETEQTIAMIEAYGIENVRGGGICQIDTKSATQHYAMYLSHKLNRIEIKEKKQKFIDSLVLNEMEWLL